MECYLNFKKKSYIRFYDNNKQNGFGQLINEDKIIYDVWKEGNENFTNLLYLHK